MTEDTGNESPPENDRRDTDPIQKSSIISLSESPILSDAGDSLDISNNIICKEISGLSKGEYTFLIDFPPITFVMRNA